MGSGSVLECSLVCEIAQPEPASGPRRKPRKRLQAKCRMTRCAVAGIPHSEFRNPHRRMGSPRPGLGGCLAEPTAGAMGYFLTLLRSFIGLADEPPALRK